MREGNVAAPGRVRTFIDLRRFAGTVPNAEAGTTYQKGRVALALPDGPVTIEALILAGHGHVERLDGDEFVIVLEGRLDLMGGTAVGLTPGQSAVLPANIAFDWSAAPDTRAIVMRCAVAPGAADTVAIDETAPLTPSRAPLDALLIGPTPSCRNHSDYQSSDGIFTCGTWDSTPYYRRAMTYGHYELMHLIAGEVTFEDESGRVGTFRAGDIFLIEQGAHCSWSSATHVKKVYAIYRPG